MNGNQLYQPLSPTTSRPAPARDREGDAKLAEHWLNLCNFTNLQQKLQLLKNDPQWAVTYEQLQLDPQLLLQTYRLPESQLQMNWQTYVELVQRAGDPTSGLSDQVPHAEMLRLVQERVEVTLQRLQAQLDAFPPEPEGQDLSEQEQNNKVISNEIQNKGAQKRIDLKEAVAYGLFNIISAYAAYDKSIDICSAQRRFMAEEKGKYCPEVGLCQLIASVFYHTKDEVSSFWITVSLIENYDMRQFYQRGMPGLALYGEVLSSLVDTHLPQLSRTLAQYGITYLDFFGEWADSHFLNQMPIDLSLELLAEFLRDGWPFFLRLCLSVLKSLQNQIFELDKANHEKPLRQKLSLQQVTEQILAVLSFREPHVDSERERAAIPGHRHDQSAMENFKDLNESAGGDSGDYAAENFVDIEDERKQFDNNFAIVDDRPPNQAQDPSKQGQRNHSKQKNKISRIVVTRQRLGSATAAEAFSEGQEAQGGVTGFFKKFRDMIGFNKEEERRRAEKMLELKRIQGLLGNRRELTAKDFVEDARETWTYLLEIVKYEWMVPEKQEAIWACSAEGSRDGISASMSSQGEALKQEGLEAVLTSEFQRDYLISKDLVTTILAQRQNIALRRFLEWQRKLQEQERDQMARKMEQARREQVAVNDHDFEQRDAGRRISPHTSGHSAALELSEGPQGPLPARNAERSKERANVHERVAPEQMKTEAPLLSYVHGTDAAGQSIVHFDALDASKSGTFNIPGQGGHQGNRKASYVGAALNNPRDPRGSGVSGMQSSDAFKPPLEPSRRLGGAAAGNLHMSGVSAVSLNLDFASGAAGGHVVSTKPVLGHATNFIGAGTISQVHGSRIHGVNVTNASGYPGLFNEADVSMMDEMNRLLMGMGETAADQDAGHRGSLRGSKGSTPTPHLPLATLSGGELRSPRIHSYRASTSPAIPRAPAAAAPQRNSAGNPGASDPQQARQSQGGSSSCAKSTKFGRDEQDDLIIGGGGIGQLPHRDHGRHSLNSQNMSKVSQLAHIENISKIEARQEEAYDNYGDVSLQRCLQLGQLSFQQKNVENKNPEGDRPRGQAAQYFQSIIKHERPANAQSRQQQFALSLQKVEEKAGAQQQQQQLRAADEQPPRNEFRPIKPAQPEQVRQPVAQATDGSPFQPLSERSPAAYEDHSKGGFGTDPFNFRDTSQLTTGERNHVQVMDIRDRREEDPDDGARHQDQRHARAERDRTKERPVDQYIAPYDSARPTLRRPAASARQEGPTAGNNMEQKTKQDFQRRQLDQGRQQSHHIRTESQRAADATLMIMPDRATHQDDSFGPRGSQPNQDVTGISSDQHEPYCHEPRETGLITSPHANRQAPPSHYDQMKPSTPAFAQQIAPRPSSPHAQFKVPYNPPYASSGNLPTRMQINCMPHAQKRTYFDNNYGSFGPAADPAAHQAQAITSPRAATRPVTSHGNNAQLPKQKPLSIKAVTPMKLLMRDNSATRQGQTIKAREREANYHPERDTLKVGSADPNRQLKDCRSPAAASGKRLSSMQRLYALESQTRGQQRLSNKQREPRANERAVAGEERDLTPVLVGQRHQGRHLRQFPKIRNQTGTTTTSLQPRREISKIIVEDCVEYAAASGENGTGHVESMDAARGNLYQTSRDGPNGSKLERSGLGTSANDSKRSLKKSPTFSKNASRSLRNLKLEDAAPIVSFQAVRAEHDESSQANASGQLGQMLNGAHETDGRLEVQDARAQFSPEGCQADHIMPELAAAENQRINLSGALQTPHPNQIADNALRQNEVAGLVRISRPQQVRQASDHGSQRSQRSQHSVLSAKQQAIKEKVQKIQEMKKQQKNKLGNSSTFGAGGDHNHLLQQSNNQTRVSHADRTNVQNNSSKSFGLGLNASSSSNSGGLIFGKGGCNSSKNNLNNTNQTNQSQEGKLGLQLNQSKMTNRTNRTNRSKNSAHSSSYSNRGYSNRLKDKVSNQPQDNQLAGQQPSSNFENLESPAGEKGRPFGRDDAGSNGEATLQGQNAEDALAIDIDVQNEPRKSLSAPKSERKSFEKRLAGEQRADVAVQNCSVEDRPNQLDLEGPGPTQMLELDRVLEEELKKLTSDEAGRMAVNRVGEQYDGQQDLQLAEVAALQRGSGNDLGLVFADEAMARGSGNDPQFRNLLAGQRYTEEQMNDSAHNQSSHQQSNYQSKSFGSKDRSRAGILAVSMEPSSASAQPSMSGIDEPSQSSSTPATTGNHQQTNDPAKKEQKVKQIQDFINNAKKSKFSEWRKQKQQNQTQSSDNQSQEVNQSGGLK